MPIKVIIFTFLCQLIGIPGLLKFQNPIHSSETREHISIVTSLSVNFDLQRQPPLNFSNMPAPFLIEELLFFFICSFCFIELCPLGDLGKYIQVVNSMVSLINAS